MKVGDLLEKDADRSWGRAQLQGRTIMVESDDATISADRQRLEYALGNLLDNGLNHGAGDLELISKLAVMLLSFMFVIMGLASQTAIWPIRSSASPQRRAPDVAPA